MNHKDLNEGVHLIFKSETDFHAIKTGIEKMKSTFESASGIVIGNINGNMLSTKNGVVVNQQQAAHCLVDLLRTTKFLKGIKVAISSKLQDSCPVRILYAGSGPYATLLTPLTTQFSSSQIAITMADINQSSLVAVEQLYQNLNIKEYLSGIILCDLTDPNLSFDHQFDIIISETMQFALRNECQVAITRNLKRHLAPAGIFIPEEIIVDAHLIGKTNALAPKETKTYHAGKVYSLSVYNLPQKNATTRLTISRKDHPLLKLYTTIKVFGDTIIQPFESGLTIPYTLIDFKDEVPDEITLMYEEGERPDWSLSYN